MPVCSENLSSAEASGCGAMEKACVVSACATRSGDDVALVVRFCVVAPAVAPVIVSSSADKSPVRVRWRVCAFRVAAPIPGPRAASGVAGLRPLTDTMSCYLLRPQSSKELRMRRIRNAFIYKTSETSEIGAHGERFRWFPGRLSACLSRPGRFSARERGSPSAASRSGHGSRRAPPIHCRWPGSTAVP